MVAKEIETFIKENKRLLLLVLTGCLLAFSSGYVTGTEGRTTTAAVNEGTKTINYQKGYRDGQTQGYKKGFALAKAKAEKKSYQASYKKAYLEQFQKAGISKPKEVSFP
jgi:hypothetical protein